MIANLRSGWLPSFSKTFPSLRLACLAACFLFSYLSMHAQSKAEEDIARGDKQFSLYAYNLAVRSFEEALKVEPNNAYALGRLADSYVQLNQPEAALIWFERSAGATQPDADLPFRYGKALMLTGDYAGAKKWFQFYTETNAAVGKHFAEMCDYAQKTSAYAPLYTTKNETINSAASEYCPAFWVDRVVFSSSRTDLKRKTEPKSAADWSGSAYNQLFVSKRDPATGFLQNPEFLRSDLQNNYNEGPVSFSADGTKMIYSRNNFIDGARQMADKGLNMSLFTAEVKEDGTWENLKAFPFNGSEYSTGFPSFSPDGNTLYFASNQPNGMGGWDIYMSKRTTTGWSTPANLGAPLNTAGNEITPYLDGANLYFSSDYHRGMGGMDVFRTELKDNAVGNIFHLGPGINSSRDDYGLIYNSTQNLGYLTSNRPGGRGNEDIWQVSKKVAPAPQPAMAEIVKPTETKPIETKTEPIADLPAKPTEKVIVNQPKTNTAPLSSIPKQATPGDLNGYAVQVGAFPPESVEAKQKQFEELSAKGNIYSRNEGSMSKIRVGVYSTKAEAQAVQKEIMADPKFKGAFVVEERGVDRNLALTPKPLLNTPTTPTPEPNNLRYAVQLDVQTGDQPLAIHDYTSLASLGRVYTKNNEKGQLSIRLGVWQNFQDAETARTSAINKGFDQSVIVQENATDPNIKPFLKSDDPSLKAISTTRDKPLDYFSINAPPPSPTKYYIRLCALSDPNNFDPSKLGDAKGKVEKWAIGETGMTAIMLTGFTDEKTVVETNEKLKTTSFPDAYVVKEENGKLNKLRN